MTLDFRTITLGECEAVIERGLSNAAFAIRKINNEDLYLAGWPTFEAYVKDRWGWTRDYAYKQIHHAETLDAIAPCIPMVDTDADPEPVPMPSTERQTRPMTGLEPEQKAEVWVKAVETARDEGKTKPTGKIVEQVVAELVDKPTVEPKQTRDHPATFSKAIMDGIVDLLDPTPTRILDPFAGIGNIHQIADRIGCDSIGIEIEHEWADLHDRTICHDSTTVTRDDVGHYDAIVTSPTYGNRMADKHNATDNSDRATYKHRLGHDLTDNNTGGLQWGTEYRQLHHNAYRRIIRLLAPGGVFILNIKDHIRDGQIQYVSDWHIAELITLGLEPPDASLMIPTKGHTQVGENTDKRVEVERIYRLRKTGSR